MQINVSKQPRPHLLGQSNSTNVSLEYLGGGNQRFLEKVRSCRERNEQGLVLLDSQSKLIAFNAAERRREKTRSPILQYGQE